MSDAIKELRGKAREVCHDAVLLKKVKKRKVKLLRELMYVTILC